MSFEIHFCHEDVWPEYVDVKIPSEREVRTYIPERTCRNVSDLPDGFLCSECGWGDFAEPSHLLTGSCYAGLAKGPRYCPNCGAKVVSE